MTVARSEPPYGTPGTLFLIPGGCSRRSRLQPWIGVTLSVSAMTFTRPFEPCPRYGRSSRTRKRSSARASVRATLNL